ncbi:HD domain-containing protein [bacterium]|nr:HD domain-containing protein [bacterium]MBU4361090.1 HD domain-containing protein [bacterium]MBU4603047.1 HD domain-containing protein [bacterium]
MKDEDKAKDQLIKELQKIREKVAGLEEVKLKYNQVDKKLKQTDIKLQKIIEDTADIITKVVELRDPYSIGHQQRVSKLATAIAQEMKLPQDKIEGIKIASLVHDIGKVNLPTEIVRKPGKLIEVEFNLLKNHPKISYDLLKKVDFPWPIAEIVFQHQEKIDGSGYPRGLKVDEICIEAKILGVANVVEAMSSYRSYRPALSIDEALAEIVENKNILFDPGVVDTCVKLFKEKGFKF